MLSILRIMVGLLYMEHGLAKILDFPHQETHAPYALFTLNPGLQGLLELLGGFLLALGFFTRTVAFILEPGEIRFNKPDDAARQQQRAVGPRFRRDCDRIG
jgi:putative oxidoreductase